MSKTLTVDGIPYQFPEQGQEAPWGEDVTDWAEAITETLSGINSTGDILTTSFEPSNNISSATDIVGFSFDGSVIQGFVADYSIYRSTTNSSDVVQEEYCETGTIHGSYLSGAGTWTITQTGDNIEETGITLSITTLGQLQYTSTNLLVPVGGTHTCRMVFRARSFTNS